MPGKANCFNMLYELLKRFQDIDVFPVLILLILLICFFINLLLIILLIFPVNWQTFFFF